MIFHQQLHADLIWVGSMCYKKLSCIVFKYVSTKPTVIMVAPETFKTIRLHDSIEDKEFTFKYYFEIGSMLT